MSSRSPAWILGRIQASGKLEVSTTDVSTGSLEGEQHLASSPGDGPHGRFSLGLYPPRLCLSPPPPPSPGRKVGWRNVYARAHPGKRMWVGLRSLTGLPRMRSPLQRRLALSPCAAVKTR